MSRLPLLVLLISFLSIFVVDAQISNSILKSRAKIENNAKLVDSLRNQIKLREDELVRAEALNKNFEKMIQLVNVLGQVDTFLTEKTKSLIKKLAMLAEDDEDESKETS